MAAPRPAGDRATRLSAFAGIWWDSPQSESPAPVISASAL
ncbi:rCG63556 [Rattus norvegicus]|uniref:RCG63556 n=1 Tax=Rattus norvegicus TaxID=10116 RepID=A6JBI8_RAT|nr:rCG63556 [Rattus norvegicus]